MASRSGPGFMPPKPYIYIWLYIYMVKYIYINLRLFGDFIKEENVK